MKNISYPPKWSTLAALGRHKIMQYTILVPLFGYMILFNDWLEENFLVYGEFPKWQVYVTYYGLTFLAVGSLVYVFRCPSVVKRFGSASEYIESEGKMVREGILFGFMEELEKMYLRRGKGAQIHAWVKASLDNIVTSESRGGMRLKVIKGKMWEDHEGIDNSHDGTVYRSTPSTFDLVEAYYDLSNQDLQISRKIVFILYALGFLLLSFPALCMLGRISIKSFELLLPYFGL